MLSYANCLFFSQSARGWGHFLTILSVDNGFGKGADWIDGELMRFGVGYGRFYECLADALSLVAVEYDGVGDDHCAAIDFEVELSHLCFVFKRLKVVGVGLDSQFCLHTFYFLLVSIVLHSDFKISRKLCL